VIERQLRRSLSVQATLVASVVLLTGGALRAETRTITLPAAASIQGGAPFYSNVRVFNISYTDTLKVTATYRCFIGNPCPSIAPHTALQLAPRESRGFDDMVVSTFLVPNSAGAIEFEFAGVGERDSEPLETKDEHRMERLTVSSRLYSTAPTPTVGMLIPGLAASKARANSLLPLIRNGGPGAGFRSNAGAFNPNDEPVDVTFQLIDGSSPVGHKIERTLEAHSGVQVSRIFAEAGIETLDTSSGFLMVNATGRVFAYAVVIDNETTDPYLVLGTEDLPPQEITPAATATRTPTQTGPSATATPTVPVPSATPTLPAPPATSTPTPPGPTATTTPTLPGPTATRTPTLPGPTATRTPTPPAATATPTRTATPPPSTATPTRTPTPPPPPPTATPTPPAAETRTVFVGGPGGSNIFVDSVEGGTDSHIHVGDTIHWLWTDTHHNTVSGSNCAPNGIWESPIQDSGSFDFTFTQAGTYPYYCDPHCDSNMVGTIFVTQ
jgi:hypothetical protein